MEDEFSRPADWTDWRGVLYTAKEEWRYVNGPARRKADCTPGTRDENNDGKSPQQFMDAANAFIRQRREAGFGVMLTEITRARIGWMPPDEEMQALRPEYYPGDLGFDPLGMAPTTDAEMLSMKNKELNNGRLAMIALAGICAQEVITGTELLGSA